MIGAIKLSIEQVVESIHHFGGLAVLSHVDRERFSVFSQLGFMPEKLSADALEVSPRHTVAQTKLRWPEVEDYPFVRSSDAHRLEKIGAASFVFTSHSPCIRELKMALAGEGGRKAVS